MSYGFEVRDSNGNIALTLAHRLCRVVGYVTVGLSPGQSMVIDVPGMANDGTWTAYLFMRNTDSSDGVNANIVISTGAFTITSYEASASKVFLVAIMRY